MAIYRLNSKKKGDKNVKKIAGFTLIGISSFAYLFLTGISSVMLSFFLGVFGVFAYALFLVLFVVGLALVNNRRYVMSKRYLFGMIFTVYFLLCIIQLIVVGGQNSLSFWQYLGLNYTAKWTAGGIVCGIITTPILFLAKEVGAYIILCVAFILSLAIFLDSLNIFRKVPQKEKKVAFNVKEKRVENPVPAIKEEKEEINVVLNGNLEEEKQEEKKVLTAREILGLDKKHDRAYGYFPKTEEKKVEKREPKSLRELILTPPEIDYQEYFKQVAKPEPPKKEEIKTNVETLKQEEMNLDNFNSQSSEDTSDEFKNVDNPFVQNDDEQEDILNQADDIIRSAVME